MKSKLIKLTTHLIDFMIPDFNNIFLLDQTEETHFFGNFSSLTIFFYENMHCIN